MMESTNPRVPDPATIRKHILAARSAFGNYNVIRLGELIRRLPEERRKSFETVPILLHLNTPRLPGFVDHPETPHGIYRFSESGFWKLGRKRLGIEEKTMQSVLLKRYYLRGVYLAGSSGTWGQTEISDLNYWVLIDPKYINEEQRDLLSRKLDMIRQWSLKNHDQPLTFLVLDHDQVRRSDFSAWAEPWFERPQGSLMKEEFYRTFILIAGQIPFWAVLPAGLNDEEYNRWIEAARKLSDADLLLEDYVDLGHVSSINRQECLGTLLSEIWRFRQDPARSLIKASLLARHCCHPERQDLPCESIKQAFSRPESGGESPDPSMYGFEMAVRFYEGMDDRDGLDLIKRCVYLRLSGYPGPRHPEETDPNRDILNRLRRRWGWSPYEGDRTESYAQWTEDERLDVEDRILHELWLLFRMVAQAAEKQKEGEETDPVGLEILRRRAEERFAKKAGQIPYASAYLRARRQPLSLRVERQKDQAGADCWAIIEPEHPDSRTDQPSLFSDPQLPRIVGWIVLNGLYAPGHSSVVFHHLRSAIAARRAEAFLEDVHRFFHLEAVGKDFRSEPVWVKLLVVLDLGLGPKKRDLTSAAFLIQNTWGEMFFFPMDLSRVENNLIRCYEVAKAVWRYQGQSPEGRFNYLIYHSRTIEDTRAAKKIEEFIGSFRKNNPGKPVS